MNYRYGNSTKRLTKSEILSGVEDIISSKFVDNNTVEYMIDVGRVIRFHHTDILIFSDDCIRISTGGWKTVTTKDRINKYLPSGVRLFSEDGFWIVTYKDKRFPFKDGMVIDLKTGTADSGDYNQALKAFKLDRKKIAVFLRKYAELFCSGKMGLPSSGDCFICQIAAQNPDYKNYDHIQSHIDESYLVPSLIWAAFKATGNEYYLNYVHALQSGVIAPLSRRDILRILRKYFNQQKG